MYILINISLGKHNFFVLSDESFDNIVGVELSFNDPSDSFNNSMEIEKLIEVLDDTEKVEK